MSLMKIERMLRQFQNIPIDEILNELGIKVIEHPRMDDKENDAILMTGQYRSVLYLKRKLPTNYKDFLILHEIGHRVQHFQKDTQYSFVQSQYTGRMEREANSFACLYLIKDDDLHGVCAIDLLVNKGVPEQIAIKFVDEYRQRL